MADTLAVAVVGAGHMGRHHARNLAHLPRARVTWVVDPVEPAGRAAAAECGARWSPALESALAAPDVEAVVVVTPSHLHAAAVEPALDARKAVFCEKPLTAELAGTRRLAARIAASGTYFQIGFMRRYDPAYAEARRAIAAGEVGRVVHVLAVSRDPEPPPEAYVRVAGGIFTDLGIHDLDAVRFLTGQGFVCAYAQAAGETAHLAAHDDADEAQALLRLDGGATATVLLSRRALYGYDIRAEVWGTEGSVRAGYLREPAVTRGDRAGLHARAVPGYLERFAAAYFLEMRDFVDRVLDGRPSPVTEADALAAAEAAEACRLSLRRRVPVDVTEVRG